MKTDNYLVHPRILNHVTWNWSFEDRKQMEARNKGKCLWILPLGTFIFISLLLSIQYILFFDDYVLALCISPAIILASVILIWGLIKHLRYMQECNRKWESVWRDILGFYSETGLRWWDENSRSYDQIVCTVQQGILIYTIRILTTTGQKSEEWRKIMGEKYDNAYQYLGGSLDECKGYKFFFNLAEAKLSSTKP